MPNRTLGDAKYGATLHHQSLAMTMRYAHLAPDNLEEATRLNPLAKMDT
ncbi:hypothetical protein [Salinicola lusitanus]|nr:hypothetical protein [Salinicola lusitanus]